MLGYIAFAGVWGFAKAVGAEAKRSHLTVDGSEVAEELQYRLGLERVVLRSLVGAGTARLASAAAFGLGHPGNEIDAALGGILYSLAYDAGGPLAAIGAHIAHNIGVYLGGIP